MPTTAEETIEAIRDTVERVIAKGFDDMIKKSIVERIDQYMAVGGDVNPEHMEHDKVRELLWDVRGYIKELEFDNWQKQLSLIHI